MAFQISDDVLDFIGAPEVTGKPAGSDVANGLITLPVLYALAHSRQSQRLAQMVTNPDLSREHTADIVRLVTRSGGIRYAQRAAERYTKRAVRSLQVFPDSPSKQMLVTAARQVSGRSY
jgi:heptaprenyl diphosphate synthase